MGKRTYSNKTMKKHGEQYCETTFHGLDNWYTHLFEKLGWMILAKANGMTDKTMLYKTSLARFKESVERKMKTTRDHDRKEDLMVMHNNICVLIEHADKDL